MRLRRPHPAGVWAAGVCLAAVAGVVVWQQASSSTAVSLGDALRTFRGGAAGSGAAAAPPAGVYTYRASGTEVGTVGPLRIRRPVPAEAHLVVSPAAGGFQIEWQISQEHVEAYRFRVAGGWATLAWRRVDVTFLGVGRDDRREVRGSARWLPLDPRPGQTWPVAFRTGTLESTGTGRVLRRENVMVDGTAHPAFVVEVATRTRGAHGGPRTERIWWSVAGRVPLRVESNTVLGGVVGFRSRLVMDLAAVRPAR